MTQLAKARADITTPEMKIVAEKEHMDIKDLKDRIALGRIVIPANINHKGLIPCGIGEGLFIKVNTNIGTSSDRISLDDEIAKLAVSVEAGADIVMDLSTGGDIDLFRRKILKESNVPIGTVPVYQAVVRAINEMGGVPHMTVDDIFDVIERQAEDGVDFITVHCGLTRAAIEMLRSQGRIMDIVSRGGAFLTAWMLHNDRENPLYENYDRLLSIAKRYDVREGVIVTKIAAHAADIARGNRLAMERDIMMSKARKALNWDTQMKYALDPVKARKIRGENPPCDEDVCTMCGKYCAVKQVREYLAPTSRDKTR